MPSLWVKWQLSAFDYTEITINDVLGEVSKVIGAPTCEARGEVHSGKTYVAKTNYGVYVLCRRCCKILGLPVRS